MESKDSNVDCMGMTQMKNDGGPAFPRNLPTGYIKDSDPRAESDRGQKFKSRNQGEIAYGMV